MVAKKKKAISTIPGKMIYHNMDFIDSEIGRPIRIIAEFMAPNQIFQQEGVQNTIVFFGSARTLPMSEIKKRLKGCKNKKEVARLKQLEAVAEYYDAAHELGAKLGRWANKQHKGFAIMTGGGPVNATNTLVYYIYDFAYRYGKPGQACAAGVVLLIFVCLITLVQFQVSKKRVHYQ